MHACISASLPSICVERRFFVRAVTDVSSNTIEYGGVFLLLEIQQVLNGFVIIIVVWLQSVVRYKSMRMSHRALSVCSRSSSSWKKKSIMGKNSIFMFSLGRSHILES
jgi:hypothetical protein